MPKINTIQKREYHTTNKRNPHITKYTSTVPHTAIKVGEDTEGEFGVIISTKLQDAAVYKAASKSLDEVNRKTWMFGKDGNTSPIDLTGVAAISLNENSGSKLLSTESKATGTLIRFPEGSVIETPPHKSHSDATILNIEATLRTRYSNLDTLEVFDPKTGDYQHIYMDKLKPIGHYKPQRSLDLGSTIDRGINSNNNSKNENTDI